MNPHLQYDIIRGIEICYTFMSALGVIVNFWATMDSRIDLRQLKIAKMNGMAERAGKINYRTSLSIMATHLIFLALGIQSLISVPQINRYNTVIVFGSLFFIFITILVVSQIYNQLDRINIRDDYIRALVAERDNNAQR